MRMRLIDSWAEEFMKKHPHCLLEEEEVLTNKVILWFFDEQLQGNLLIHLKEKDGKAIVIKKERI